MKTVKVKPFRFSQQDDATPTIGALELSVETPEAETIEADTEIPTIGNLPESPLTETERKELIAELLRCHGAIVASRESRIAAGHILIKLKAGVPHGEFLPLLKCLHIGKSTAENYINAALGVKPKPRSDGKTANGYALDEIRHVFQTSIRQGDEHRAMQCLVELESSGMMDWVWRRLPVIASEDVGLAELGLQAEIENLRLQYRRKANDSRFHSYRLFIVHAVLLLARVHKSRLTDHALITYYQSQAKIEITDDEKKDATASAERDPDPQIADGDLDKHTLRGRKTGRRNKTAEGINHFFDVGAKLENEAPIPDPYKEKARQALLPKKDSLPPTPDDPNTPDPPPSTPVPHEGSRLKIVSNANAVHPKQTSLALSDERQPNPNCSGLYYIPSSFSLDDADRLFRGLSTLPWDRHVIPMYGKKIPAPRLFQWMGIPPTDKSYSGGVPTEGRLYGAAIKPIEWTPEALEIRERVRQETGISFNSLNLNFYRDEKDHLGYHVDKEDEGSWEFPIASVSLGAERDFQIQRYEIVNQRKRNQIGEVYTTRLSHGSLIVMPAQMQASWVHRVKKQTAKSGPRINLTFRMMNAH